MTQCVRHESEDGPAWLPTTHTSKTQSSTPPISNLIERLGTLQSRGRVSLHQAPNLWNQKNKFGTALCPLTSGPVLVPKYQTSHGTHLVLWGICAVLSVGYVYNLPRKHTQKAIMDAWVTQAFTAIGHKNRFIKMRMA